MLTGDPALLLGLSTGLGFLALLLKRPVTAARLLLLVGAALFGTAVGTRAAGVELHGSPLPPVLRFVLMASFGSFAFHRSWCWLREKLAAPLS